MGAAGTPYDDAAFVARYARARPRPPRDLLSLLIQLCRRDPPKLVVDLGCGTGLSTVAWRRHASHVIGIDSNPLMLERAPHAANIVYRTASADSTGVVSGSADIVTCSQSFHWMKPRSTIREIARVLRPGGVFAAYDYALPPLIDPRVDEAFAKVLRWSGLPTLPVEKAGHVERLSRSGDFEWVRNIPLHSVEYGGSKRVIDLALSIAHVAARVQGTHDRGRAWTQFRDVVDRTMGRRRWRFWWTYDVVVALRASRGGTRRKGP